MTQLPKKVQGSLAEDNTKKQRKKSLLPGLFFLSVRNIFPTDISHPKGQNYITCLVTGKAERVMGKVSISHDSSRQLGRGSSSPEHMMVDVWGAKMASSVY